MVVKVQDTTVALGAEVTSVETPQGHHAVRGDNLLVLL